MLPSDQRFSPERCTRGIHLNLIVQTQLMGQGFVQPSNQGVPRLQRCLGDGVVKPDAIAPILFGLVHGRFGMLYQCLGRQFTASKQADTDTQ